MRENSETSATPSGLRFGPLELRYQDMTLYSAVNFHRDTPSGLRFGPLELRYQDMTSEFALNPSCPP